MRSSPTLCYGVYFGGKQCLRCFTNVTSGNRQLSVCEPPSGHVLVLPCNRAFGRLARCMVAGGP